MRTFDHPNFWGGWRCPVCKTSADAPVTLIPIPGTETDGIVQCKQVHAECAQLAMKMAAMSEGER